MNNELTLHLVAIEAAQIEGDVKKAKEEMEVKKEDLSLLTNGICDHVLIAAKKHNTDHETFRIEYKDECAWLKSPEGERDTGVKLGGKIPRSFIQAVSDVIAGMKMEINPNEFDTYNSFRDAKIISRKEAKEAEAKEAEKAKEEPMNIKLAGVGDAVQRLLIALKGVNEVEEDKIIAILSEARSKINNVKGCNIKGGDAEGTIAKKVAKKVVTKKVAA